MRLMDRKLVIGALVAAGIAGLASQGSATLIASESFDYAAGGLSGKGGGTGWGGAWTTGSPGAVVGPGDSGGSALQVTGNSFSLAYRPLALPVAYNDVYVSFLFQLQGGQVGNNDFAAIWFDAAVTGDHTNAPNIGLKGNKETGPAINPDFFARSTGTSGSFSTDINGSRDTYFVVGHFLKKGASTKYNRFDMWIDPDVTNLGTPDAIFKGSSTLSQFNYVGFRTANLDSDDRVNFDELRIGTTLADVMPAPEPGTMLLLGSGLFGLAAVARRGERR